MTHKPDGTLSTRIYARYLTNDPQNAVPTGELQPGETRIFSARVLPYVTENRDAEILDVGCGSGRLLAFLAAEGYLRARGIDLSREMIARAHTAGVENVEYAEATAYLRGIDATLDAICAFDVLEHLSKSEVIAFLEVARRALKPGGRLILQVPNGASPFFGSIYYADLTHETVFTARSIRMAFQTVDLVTVSVSEVVPLVHGPRSLLRRVIWAAGRAAILVFLAAETGRTTGYVLSQNLLAVAERER